MKDFAVVVHRLTTIFRLFNPFLRWILSRFFPDRLPSVVGRFINLLIWFLCDSERGCVIVIIRVARAMANFGSRENGSNAR